MTASEDEYDAQSGAIVELTDDDCAAIDARSAEILADYASTVAVRSSAPNVVRTNHPSPIQRFRPNGRLSVSDLVAPSWCEVQFEYGLLQGRSSRIDLRPKSFVSNSGKQIHVERSVAETNDIVLHGGQVVHSALEREVHPTKVEVKTKTLEEYWGLRLFNMISDLQTLVSIGKCREFKVMGFMNDQFITGIIDEITRTPVQEDLSEQCKRTRDFSAPSTPSKSNSKRIRIASSGHSSPEKQSKIDLYFPISPGKSLPQTENVDHINNSPTVESMAAQNIQETNELMQDGTHFVHFINNKTRTRKPIREGSSEQNKRIGMPSRSSSKRIRMASEQSPAEEQSTIDSYFPISPEKSLPRMENADHINNPQTNEPIQHRTHVLHLIDNKTRRTRTLPDHSATLSSRLQLMAYKRLLDALITFSPRFDFQRLWNHLGLDPEMKFSRTFIDQIMLNDSTGGIKCLKDLEKYWWSAVWELGVGGGDGQNPYFNAPVDPELALVYRIRHGFPRKKGRKTPGHSSEQEHMGTHARTGEKEDQDSKLTTPEDNSLWQVATSESHDPIIPAQLNDRSHALGARTPEEQPGIASEESTDHNNQHAMDGPSPNGTTGYVIAETSDGKRTQESTDGISDKILQRAPEGAFDQQEDGLQENTAQELANESAVKREIEPGTIIDQKKFEHDDLMLDNYIANILAWWHGEREPRGVDIEESSRCYTCEYMEGCEWREAQALEARALLRHGGDLSVSG